jgi:ATP-dependent Clp protease adaptor protein ClpS
MNIESVEQQSDVHLAPPPMYNVIYHNDDFTTMNFVCESLQEYFGKSAEDAAILTLDIHEFGTAMVAVMPQDIAQTKAETVMREAQAQEYPLLITLTPASSE